MSNRVPGQTLFALQAQADGVYVAGPAGSGMLFTSIQAAIDQAFADGFNSNANPAFVLVLPGTYTEDLTFKTGVNLGLFTGLSGGALNASNGTGSQVQVIGNHTFSPVGGTASGNSIAIQNINFSVLNGVCLTHSGSGAGTLTVSGCQIQKQAGGDAVQAVLNSNSGGGTTRLQNNSSVDHNVAGSTAVEVTGNGIFEMRDRRTRIFSTDNVSLANGVLLSGAASQFQGYACANMMNGNYSVACIQVNNATALAESRYCSIQNTRNTGAADTSSTIKINQSGATARCRWCLLQLSGTVANGNYLVQGVAGGIFTQGSNVIANGATNNAIKNVLTIQTDTSNGTATA